MPQRLQQTPHLAAQVIYPRAARFGQYGFPKEHCLSGTHVQVSVWYGRVLRGDLSTVRVGAFSNIQDRTVIHAARCAPLNLALPEALHEYAKPTATERPFLVSAFEQHLSWLMGMPGSP